ncbi:MAG: prenyltransferase [Parasporobacterium sp.]|nr:prenyltransferase [Parasporobacterium sp.]
MPALVAAFLATKYADFRWYLALLSVIGIGFAHLSLNMFDDYFDFKNAEQGDRTALVREGFRAMTAKCPPLQDGTVSSKQWLLASCIYGAIACCFGIPVLIVRGLSVLWVVLGVAVLGLFYSAPPLKLGYHGLGELIIGVIFGPGVFIGMNLAAAGEFHASEVFISCAMGLIVVGILYVHSIMDYAADAKAGKRTLAWLVGCHATIPSPGKEVEPPSETQIEAGRTRQYITLALIIFVPYVLMILAAVLRFIQPYYLVSLLALPWSVDLFRSMLDFKKDPFAPVTKKWWYGNFQMWDQIKENHLDWFMLRWLLAQRISIVFSILCILASIAEMITIMINM